MDSGLSLLQWARRAAAAMSGRDEKLAIMSRTPVFSGCGRRELVDLASIFEVSFVHPGQLLQRRGTRCKWWTIVAEGTALAFDGDDPVGLPQWWVGLLDAGESWDEESISSGGPCQVSISALTPMVLLIADLRSHKWLVERHDCLASWRESAGQRQRRSTSPALEARAVDPQLLAAESGDSFPVRLSRS